MRCDSAKCQRDECGHVCRLPYDRGRKSEIRGRNNAKPEEQRELIFPRSTLSSPSRPTNSARFTTIPPMLDESEHIGGVLQMYLAYMGREGTESTRYPALSGLLVLFLCFPGRCPHYTSHLLPRRYSWNKPEAYQPLAGGYTSAPGTVSCGCMTLVLGNECYHRTRRR